MINAASGFVHCFTVTVNNPPVKSCNCFLNSDPVNSKARKLNKCHNSRLTFKPDKEQGYAFLFLITLLFYPVKNRHLAFLPSAPATSIKPTEFALNIVTPALPEHKARHLVHTEKHYALRAFRSFSAVNSSCC